jgi:hypothetical protein
MRKQQRFEQHMKRAENDVSMTASISNVLNYDMVFGTVWNMLTSGLCL